MIKKQYLIVKDCLAYNTEASFKLLARLLILYNINDTQLSKLSVNLELAKNTRERIHETALHMDIDVPLYDTDSVIRHLENYISKKEQEERFREWEKMQAEISSVDGLIHESSRMFSNS